MNYSASSTFEATGVHHGYATAPATSEDFYDVAGQPARRLVPDPVKVWWGRLDPGGFIIPHIDAGPWYTRWHYPVEPAGWTWQEGEGLFEAPTLPFPITHWEPHAVWNDTDRPRVHLLVEYAEPVDRPTTDLILCPMIPEVQALIDAIQTTRV